MAFYHPGEQTWTTASNSLTKVTSLGGALDGREEGLWWESVSEVTSMAAYMNKLINYWFFLREGNSPNISIDNKYFT